MQCDLEALGFVCASICTTSEACVDAVDGAAKLELLVEEIDASLDLVDDCWMVCQARLNTVSFSVRK